MDGNSKLNSDATTNRPKELRTALPDWQVNNRRRAGCTRSAWPEGNGLSAARAGRFSVLLFRPFEICPNFGALYAASLARE
jgi:hypothetical protein